MKLFSVGLIGVVGAVLNGIASFITARSLGSSQYAAFASAIASITILQVFAQGLQFSSLQEFRKEKKQIEKNRSNWLVRELIPIALVIGLFLALFRKNLNFTQFQSLGIFSMIFPVIILSSISGYYLSKDDLFRYQLLSTQVAIIRLMFSLAILAVIQKYPLVKGPAIYLGALVAANYAIAAIKLIFLKHMLTLNSLIWKKETLRYVLVITISWLLMQSDLIVINIALPPTEAGIYSAYSSIAKVLISFFAIYGLHLAGKNEGLVTLSLKLRTVAVSGVTAVGLLFVVVHFGGSLLMNVYGEEFDPSFVDIELIYAPSVLWAVVFSLLYLRLSTIEGILFPISLVCLTITIIFSLTVISATASVIYTLYSATAVLCIILLTASGNRVQKD
jgi:O-antigen/teichoic acid export membrane protein